MINILIADDQNFVRKTIESYLKPESDLNIVGFAENGEVAIDKVAELKPDVVLMDIEMPVMDGLTATKTIVEKFSDTKVLILSIHDREQDLLHALRLGARGYWLKNTTAKELADSIRHVHQGYFQIALELVEKHFRNSQKSSIQTEGDAESNNNLEAVDPVLAKIEQKIDSIDRLTPQSLNETIEKIIKHQMSIKVERDDNLQFRFDRLRHQLNRLENKTSLTFKTMLIGNLILVAAVLAFSYFAR